MTEPTQEEKRIRIAEFCGYTNVDLKGNGWLLPDSIGDLPIAITVPDYFTSLDAMHEAEKKLETDEQIESYIEALTDECGSDVPVGQASFAAYFATAAQRAEAFGRAAKLW